MQPTKKILIISYYWPPAGGPGVQRWLKFVKYLPDFNIEPHVYIPENPIGFVKSENDLVEEIAKNFDVVEHISLNTTNFVIIFAKRKNI